LEIEVLKLTIALDNKLSTLDAGKVRGFLGNLFSDDSHIHQHRLDGSFIYRYPRIQYKIIEGQCILIGFGEGNETVKEIFNRLRSLNIRGRWQEILSSGLEIYKASFSSFPNEVTYTFLTPWLALNEKNYKKYHLMGSLQRRKELLESILIGNILSISKSLGYIVQQPLTAGIENIKEVQTRLKDIPMLGFLGRFSVNFEIPDYWGIGKSVSRGFGTVKKCSS